MKTGKFTTISLLGVLFNLLQGQNILAFTLDLGNGGAIRYYQGSIPYEFTDQTGVYSGLTTLKRVEKINMGGTRKLRELLADPKWKVNNWLFTYSTTQLPGTIRVVDYMACGYNTICGSPNTEDREKIGVGAYINIEYSPPTNNPIQGELHWIQKISNNHAKFLLNGTENIDPNNVRNDPNFGHGELANALDQPPFQNKDPFYAGPTTPTTFKDTPYRTDPRNSHFWNAQLFPVILRKVKGAGGIIYNDVTIYDGLKWGWQNTVRRQRQQDPAFCPVSTNSTCGGFYTDLIGGGIGPLLPGYTRNDDSSFAFNLNYPFTYFDKTYNSLYINNNGNVSFGREVSSFIPQSLTVNSTAPIIAPYWADVDTRARGSVRIRTDLPNQTIITWNNVGYFSQKQDKLASFQLVLRGDNYDIPPGEGNIGFFYKNIGWESGSSSGGVNGFGGIPAAAGFGDGSSKVNPGEQMIAGSMQNGISQLVSNNHFWFNLRNNCTGGSGGGGCSPKITTVATNTDYIQSPSSNSLDPTELTQNLQNSVLFSPNSSPSSSSKNSWIDEINTVLNNYQADNPETNDKLVPVEEPESKKTKISSKGRSETNPTDVPEPTSALTILVFALGVVFKKWKLKGYK